MDAQELQAILGAIDVSRTEHREDLLRVHARLDEAMTAATGAATQSVAFQATTAIELKNIGGRFDIQNGRLFKAEQEILALKAAKSFSDGEIAMREKFISAGKTVAGILTKPWFYAFLTMAGGIAVAVHR
jgi:hypothetical protein